MGLQHTKWPRIVLDEAHKICSRKTKVFHALEAKSRCCLGDTPAQNRLDDKIVLTRKSDFNSSGQAIYSRVPKTYSNKFNDIVSYSCDKTTLEDYSQPLSFVGRLGQVCVHRYLVKDELERRESANKNSFECRICGTILSKNVNIIIIDKRCVRVDVDGENDINGLGNNDNDKIDGKKAKTATKKYD